MSFDKLLTILLIINPIIILNTKYMPILALRQIVFIASSFALIAAGFYLKQKRPLISSHISIGLILSVSGLLFSKNVHVLIGTLIFALSVFTYSTIYSHGQNIDFKRIVYWVCGINIFFMTIQILGYDPAFVHHANLDSKGMIEQSLVNPRAIGTLLSTTWSGFYLVLSCCFFPLWACVLVFPFIIATKATISIFSCIVIIIWKASIIDSIFGYFLVIVFFIFAFFCAYVPQNFEYFSNKLNIRAPIWDGILKGCFQRPYGYGIGSWNDLEISTQITRKYNTTWNHMGCQYLHVLWDIGFGGIVLVGYYIKKTLKNINTSLGMACVVCLIVSIFQAPLTCYSVLLTIIAIFAFKNIENKIIENNRRISPC